MKISGHFINVSSLKKPKFQLPWHAVLSGWSHFEHSNTKMDSPNIVPLYSRLCASIASAHSTSKFHFVGWSDLSPRFPGLKTLRFGPRPRWAKMLQFGDLKWHLYPSEIDLQLSLSQRSACLCHRRLNAFLRSESQSSIRAISDPLLIKPLGG